MAWLNNLMSILHYFLYTVCNLVKIFHNSIALQVSGLWFHYKVGRKQVTSIDEGWGLEGTGLSVNGQVSKVLCPETTAEKFPLDWFLSPHPLQLVCFSFPLFHRYSFTVFNFSCSAFFEHVSWFEAKVDFVIGICFS